MIQLFEVGLSNFRDKRLKKHLHFIEAFGIIVSVFLKTHR